MVILHLDEKSSERSSKQSAAEDFNENEDKDAAEELSDLDAPAELEDWISRELKDLEEETDEMDGTVEFED